jgi:hypothetical protein
MVYGFSLTAMENVKEFILQVLPGLPNAALDQVISCLSSCGFKNTADFQLIEERDLTECFKQMQIRKPLRASKREGVLLICVASSFTIY